MNYLQGIKISGVGEDFKKIKSYIINPAARLLVKLANSVSKSRAFAKILDLQTSGYKGLSSFYSNSRKIFLKKEIETILGTSITPDQPDWVDLDSAVIGEFPALSQYSVGEITNYTLDVLIKDTDQMSMAWALEVREPFFDYHLLEYVLGVPDDFKYSEKTPKYLLVEAMGELLPPEIVYRPKKGFSFPWDYWLRNELRSYCEAAIENLDKRNLFKPGGLQGYWKKFLAKDKTITWTHIWSFVVLEKWMEENEIPG